MIQHARIGPHASRSALSAGLQMLLLPLHLSSAPSSVNGAAVSMSDALLVAGGSEFHCHCRGELEWAAVALPSSLLEEAAEVAMPPVIEQGAVTRLRLLDGPSRRLADALSAAAVLAGTLPETLLIPGCADGLAMSLQEMVIEALTADASARPFPRAAREAQRIVVSAEDFLVMHLDTPIYTSQLCTALSVSARKLYDAFMATVGMSPHVYLKSRRLANARRVLQQEGADPSSIKSVALTHGFWHLGNFARDYRRSFGEAPSATRAVSGLRL
jgi:AraC family ethanolamine operon transcriptional activator